MNLSGGTNYALITQLVEYRLDKAEVPGSSPGGGTITKEMIMAAFVVLIIFVVLYFFIRKL